MPYLRHPVGPLPAAIYWRRRAVVLVVLLGVLALVLWLFLGGGGGGDGHAGAPPTAPASSIGPSTGGSGAPSPGSSGSASGGSTSGGSAGSSGGSGASPAPTGGSVSVSGGAGSGSSGSGGSAGSGSGGSGGSGGGSGSGGVAINTPPVMALPQCAPAALELALDGARSVYPAGSDPVFRLTLRNSGGAACRIDVGRTSAVVTVSSSGGGQVWSSADCPSSRSPQWVELNAGGGSVTVSFSWARTHSQPGCPSGSTGYIAGGGNFVAQAALGGVSNKPQWTFRLVAAGS